MFLYSVITIIFTLLCIVIYKYASLRAEKIFLDKSIDEYKLQISDLIDKNTQYTHKVEQLSAKSEYQSQLINELRGQQDKLSDANKIAMHELGAELSKKLIDTHKRETRENREISEKNIKDSSNKFNEQFEKIITKLGVLDNRVANSENVTDKIKNALLSPSSAGSLAEITLENTLNISGLRKNIDFQLQYSTTSEDNKKLRPDAIVFLPENSLMIIDAKASKFFVESTEEQNLIKTMNFHLRSLSNKNYAKSVVNGMNRRITRVMTLMFLPTEHAVERIGKIDKDFATKAYKENIFVVGPSGLMNILLLAKHQISTLQTTNSQNEIIDEVKKLLTSLSIMADHSERLSNSITNVVVNYDKFAGSFNSRLMSKARNLNKMGLSFDEKEITGLKRFELITKLIDNKE